MGTISTKLKKRISQMKLKSKKIDI